MEKNHGQIKKLPSCVIEQNKRTGLCDDSYIQVSFLISSCLKVMHDKQNFPIRQSGFKLLVLLKIKPVIFVILLTCICSKGICNV